MSIKHVILGFLSVEPLSGYDLKKKFADSDVLYWSGNNNQIYRALVQLHEDDLVTQEIEYQDDSPPRKEYAITATGHAALNAWVTTPPELPQLKNPFMIQLLWADGLEDAELADWLAVYAEELRVKILMLREQAARRPLAPDRTAREAYLWQAVAQRWIAFHEQELAWVESLWNG